MFKLDIPAGFHPPAVDEKWLDCARIDDVYPLPRSYLEFAREYGYGRALGLLIMYAPIRQHPDSILAQGDKVRQFIRTAIEGRYMEYGPDGSRDISESLFPFAMSENGEYLAWALKLDPSQPCRDPEYAIYCVAARMAGMRYAAKDLEELLQRLTSPEVRKILGSGYSPLPKTFQPLALGGNNAYACEDQISIQACTRRQMSRYAIQG